MGVVGVFSLLSSLFSIPVRGVPVRLESALEIIGALKRRFGEPMTATDVCRDVSLSYQPVYATIQLLAARGAVASGKVGQRLRCEPAATAAGSLWLAHWSAEEWRRHRSVSPGELAGALESRISAAAAAAGELVALDARDPSRPTVLVTDAGLVRGLEAVRVEVVARDEWAEALAGAERDWAVARRIVPLCGAQLIWSIALAARDRWRAEPAPEPEPQASGPEPRRREFVD
jgi:hypothetical protein